MCQRVLAFLESPVLFQISLRHFIQACFTFLTAVNFSLKKEIFLVRTLHLFTCIYSQVFLYLRHIVVLIDISMSQLLFFHETSKRRLIHVPEWR